MKKIANVVLIVVSIFFGMMKGKASDDGAFPITDLASLKECLENESICRLKTNLSLEEQIDITHDLILDLNGKKIEPAPTLQLNSGLIMVQRGAKLTINDSKGSGTISTGSKGNVWASIQLIKENSGTDVAELEVNGGTIEGYYYGISGNGTQHHTKITINSGNIKGLNQEDSAGIYQPQQGELIINNGNISGGTGIEIRSGSLIVKNGTIKGIASKFIKTANKGGTTTNGVGITVAQHTTKNPIKVIIENGTITGQYAFYEWNPHHHEESDLRKINLQINGGVFEGYATGVSTIYSEDFKSFVTGGKFNKDISDYAAPNATVTSKIEGENMPVFQEQKEKKNLFLPILFISVSLCIIVGILFCKQQRLFWFN